MFYRVTLLNDSKVKDFVDIVWSDEHEYYYVLGNHAALKHNIESILDNDAYILAPGIIKRGYASDGVAYIPKETPYFFKVIPQILAWRGYNAVLHEEVHKSIDAPRAVTWRTVLKAAGQDIVVNADGDTIVKRVPQGYYAVNKQTNAIRVGGQYLNANISKPDAVWYLIEAPGDSPYANMSQEDRNKYYNFMLRRHGRLYDPLANPALYENEGEGAFVPDWYTIPEGAVTLNDYVTEWAKAHDIPKEALIEALEAKIAPESKAKAPIPVSEAALEESYVDDVLSDEQGLEEVEDARYLDADDYDIPEGDGVMFSPSLGVAFHAKVFDKVLSELPPGFEKHDWYVMPRLKGHEMVDDNYRRVHGTKLGGDPYVRSGVTTGLVKIQKVSDFAELRADDRLDGHEEWMEAAIPWDITGDPVPGQSRANIKLNQTPLRSHYHAASYDPPKGLIARTRRLVNKYLTGDEGILQNIGRGFRYDFEKALAIELPEVPTPGDEVEPDDLVYTGDMSLRPYQNAVLAGLLDFRIFERYGGPLGVHGAMIFASYGIGKTVMGIKWLIGCANKRLADGEKHFNVGRQTAIITAPKKVMNVWENDIGRFVDGQEAIVIRGTAEQRMTQWEEVFQRARDGTLPMAIVVPSSVFRYEHQRDDDRPDLPDDNSARSRVPCMDALCLQLLARGGSMGDIEVTGNHVANFIIDESGQFVNRDTSRQEVLRGVLDDFYHSGALNLSLNGDITGNSASDAISELSFLNAVARDDAHTLINEYTDPFLGKESEGKKKPYKDKRRKWKSKEKLKELLTKFGTTIIRLSGQAIAGLEYGLAYTDPIITDIGHNWGGIYKDAESLQAAAGATGDKEMRNRAMGLLAIQIGASLGALHPARMLDYNIGIPTLLNTVRQNPHVTDEDIERIQRKITEYQRKHVENLGSVDGKRDFYVPIGGDDRANAMQRTREFIEMFNHTEEPDGSVFADADLLEEAIGTWDVPIADEAIDILTSELTQRRSLALADDPSATNVKMVVAGFSRRFIENLQRKLVQRGFGEDNVLIQMVTGDTSEADVRAIQDRHIQEKERAVISLVTSAARYGLSLPSQRSIRLGSWNPATGKQMTGRGHREPVQGHIASIIAPSGILATQMLALAARKEGISEEAASVIDYLMEFATGDFMDSDDDNDIAIIDMPQDVVDTITKPSRFGDLTKNVGLSVREQEDKDLADKGELEHVLEKRRAERESIFQRTLDALQERRAAGRKEREEAERTYERRLRAKKAAATRKRNAEQAKSTKKSVTRKSFPIPVRVYDKPTLSRNPLYDGDKKR